LVAQPQDVALDAFHGEEVEAQHVIWGRGVVSIDEGERRPRVPSDEAGIHQDADLVDQAGPDQHAVERPPAVRAQRPYAVLFVQLLEGPAVIHMVVAGDDTRDLPLAQVGEIRRRGGAGTQRDTVAPPRLRLELAPVVDAPAAVGRLATISWLCAILDEAKTTEKVPV